MGAIVLYSGAEVDEADALLLRGIQTDLYNEILGGHQALFDPLQSGLANIANGGVLPNLVSGGGSGTVGVGSFADIATHKGLRLQGGRIVLLPDEFDLSNLSGNASAVVSLWVTRSSASGAASLIAGAAYQTGAGVQWLVAEAAGGGLVLGADGGSATYAWGTPTSPHLITIYCEHTGGGVMRRRFFFDGTLLGETTGTYPIVNPADASGSWGGPVVVSSSPSNWTGWGNGFNGVLHRAQVLQVDPAAFDIEGWIADEISGNASRFT